MIWIRNNGVRRAVKIEYESGDFQPDGMQGGQMKKTKVGIFMADSNGGYPVPAVKGGAVQGLVEHLVRENSKKQLFEMHIISIYDEEAEKISRQYPGIHFHFVKTFF